MKFEALYPSHPLLKQYIRYYYFVKTNNKEHQSRYYSFPNITIPVNIHKHIDFHINNNKITIKESNTLNYTTIVNGMRESPLLVEWNGIIDKVTIAFTPVGINHFIRRNLNEAVIGYTNKFTEWDGDNYSNCLADFYQTSNNDKRVALIEGFLLSIYRPFDKQDLLQQAIDLLTDFKQEQSITKIATSIITSERTLNRLFKLYIGISPVAYRKIARFRQSLENKVVKEKFKRLTDISYESNYYDQSYFIKMNNKLSGKSPANLYKAVDKLADDNVIFEFLENTIDFG